MNTQTTYRGQPSLRVKVLPVFERNGRETPFRELAKRFNCTESAIRRLWETWTGKEERQGKAQCTRCGFYEWEHNPVWDGLCLWCRAQAARVDLGDLVGRWGWESVITIFQEGKLP